MKKKLIACLAAIVLALSIPTAIASAYSTLPLDVGNHNRYSGGRHRSSGGSHRSSGGSSRKGGSSITNDPTAAFIALGILLAVGGTIAGLIIYGLHVEKKKRLATTPKNFNFQIAQEMLKTEPDFNFHEFLKFAENTFIELQYAWTARDWEKVRTLESEALFEHHNTQLQEYIRLGRINKVENIKVKKSYLHEYIIEKEYEYLTVYLDVTMLDYIVDEKTNKVIMGNNKVDCNMRYLLTFARTTNRAENSDTIICPHCGAEVETGNTGLCPFCGSVIHADIFDWVLSDLESINNNSVIGDGGILNK